MPFHFNDLMVISPPLMLGLSGFPDFYNFFSSSVLTASDWNHYYFNAGTAPWFFNYFFGSFVKDFGAVGTLVIFFTIFIISIIYVYKIKNNRKVYFEDLMVFYLYSQVGFMGFFYFRHYALNNFLILYILLVLLFFILRLARVR